MTTVKIAIPDQQAAVLTAKAAAQGLTLEGWFQRIAAQEMPAEKGRYSLSELITQCDIEAPLSDEDLAWMNAPPIGREAL